MFNQLFSKMNSVSAASAPGARSKRAAIFAGLLASVCASGAAHSQSAQPAGQRPENNFEVTPFIGYMGGGEFEDPTDGSTRDVQSDTNWGLFLNLNADSPERQYELLYTRQSTTVDGAVPLDLNIQYLQIGGSVNFTDV